jgi:curli biogenesis system outer membrane secretion channel CsgG
MRRHVILCLTAILLAIPPQAASAQQPLSERPTITVTSFDYGSVATQVNDDPRTRRGMEHAGIRNTFLFAEALGSGAADLIVEKLVESERFRVYERKRLDEVRREQQLRNGDDSPEDARYVITGSISRFGFNDKHVGGLASGIASGLLLRRIFLVNTKSSSTTIHLTARVVDTRTGEIIGSFTGEGTSKKRWGVMAGGLAGGGLGGVNIADKNFRETAAGEAATRAAAAVVEQVIALRATRLRP